MRPEPPAIVEPLTRREMGVLILMAENKTNREIAEQETLTLGTVKWYVNQILGKLGAADRVQAVERARELGLLGIKAEKEESQRIPRNNLTRQLSSFIGREQAIAQVLEMVRASPLVTLTGSGGTGKTRLALKVGERILAYHPGLFPDGVWLVQLGLLVDGDLIPQACASVFGLGEASVGRTATQQLIDYLSPRRSLLILDNCEHVVGDVAMLVERLLPSCSGLHILASSREILGVNGETTFRCPSLALPNPQHHPPLAELSRVEALHLFVERAQAVSLDFKLVEENAADVAAICQCLDGIPLAIELAAARVGHLSLEQIIERLKDRFRLLTGGSRTALPRQQTLRASIDWSYSLLSPPERLLLQRLSVFTGGWTLEAAEQVCGFGDLVAEEVLDRLASLVNKSLVMIDPVKGDFRYHMLETVRQYAQEKLVDSETAELARDRHLAYFMKLAQRIEPELRGRTQIERLGQLEIELENYRRAFGWALQVDVETELRLAAALMWYWHLHSRKREGLGWLEQGLKLAEGKEISAEVRAYALAAAGCLHTYSEWDMAEKMCQESLHIFQSLGPAGVGGAAFALTWLGETNRWVGNYERSIDFCTQALELYQGIKNPFQKSECLLFLGFDFWRMEIGSPKARQMLKDCLDIRLEIGDPDGIATVYSWLGSCALDEMQLEEARSWFEKSRAIYEQVGNHESVANLELQMGFVARLEGDAFRAIEHYHKAVEIQNANLSAPLLAAVAHSNIGKIERNLGHHELAREYLHKAVAQFEKNHLTGWLGEAHIDLGALAWQEGDRERACTEFKQGLDLLQTTADSSVVALYRSQIGRMVGAAGDQSEDVKALTDGLAFLAGCKRWWDAVEILEELACLAASAQPEKAARLFGAVEHMNRYQVNIFSPPLHTAREEILAQLKTLFGEEGLAALWAEGKAMSYEAAVALALQPTAG